MCRKRRTGCSAAQKCARKEIKRCSLNFTLSLVSQSNEEGFNWETVIISWFCALSRSAFKQGKGGWMLILQLDWPRKETKSDVRVHRNRRRSWRKRSKDYQCNLFDRANVTMIVTVAGTIIKDKKRDTNTVYSGRHTNWWGWMTEMEKKDMGSKIKY